MHTLIEASLLQAYTLSIDDPRRTVQIAQYNVSCRLEFMQP